MKGATKKSMIYTLEDRMPFKHILLYGFQELLAILVATILISSITNISVGAGFIGAGVGTLIYILFTKGKSNVYLSNSGCYVAPTIFALAAAGGTGAALGGITIAIIYFIFGIVFSRISIEKFYKLIPIPLIGATTILIGLSLISYVPSYIGDTGNIGTIIALITAIIIVTIMHYGKGHMKTLPFLIGIGIGYIICLILTLTGIYNIIDFSVFKNVSFFQLPTFGWMNDCQAMNVQTTISIIIMFIPFALAASCEVWADHQAMSAVIGRDLIKENTPQKIFFATGLANIASGFISGIPLTTYGEGTGCTAASRVANARVTAMTSLFLILFGFCGYIQAFILSIPSIIFAGASMVLYPLIAIAGFKMLINNKTDLDNSKNLAIVAIPLSIGLSGIAIGGTSFSFSGVAFALIVGVILNIILKDKNHEK